ncbi:MULTISPECIES: META domain-containing protein [Bacteroidaceae]|uniref:META domain-containing protein n=1 Tax=Bacteroidaceae TaxID=815 RepID=UPI0025A0DCA4|nr:META domain-containing protein [Bacteroides intestinalis]
MKIIELAIISLCLLLFSCEKHSSVELYGKWQIVEYKCIASSSPIGLSKVTDDDNYSLEFDNRGNVICNTDCNLVTGKYVIDGNRLAFDEITSTELACDNMLVEGSVKSILPNVSTFEIQNDSLLFLKDADNQTLMELKKTTN